MYYVEDVHSTAVGQNLKGIKEQEVSTVDISKKKKVNKTNKAYNQIEGRGTGS